MYRKYDINLITLRLNLIEKKISILKKYYKEGVIEITNIKDAGFAKHNPTISNYCLKKPENLIQALIFCVASQGVGWNVVAPLFRKMYAKLLKDGTLWSKEGESYELYDWRAILGTFGKNKISAISVLWKDQVEIFQNTKTILSRWHYEDDSEESRDAVMHLFDYYTTLPGLGIAKAGFAVQLVAGALGCFDSVNAKLYSAKEIPSHIHDELISYGKDGERLLKAPSIHKDYAKRVKRLNAYKEFLDGLATEVSKPTSERLWDIWVTIVADRIRNILVTGKREDNSTIVKKNGEGISSHGTYKPYVGTPDIQDWQVKYKDITPEEVSSQHHPEYLIGGRD